MQPDPRLRVERPSGAVTFRIAGAMRVRGSGMRALALAGLDAEGIVDTVLKALRHNSAGVVEGARA